MCGRFTRQYDWAELSALYNLSNASPPSNLQPRYNICPTTPVDVVVPADGTRVLAQMRWGIVPHWWTQSLQEMKLATFNARWDRIVEAPMFRQSFQRRRCLMPVSGYYEWQTVGKEKQPFYFTRRDGGTMTVAAIYDGWVDPETGEMLRSCAMVITEPNKFVSEVHDRMPVMLEQHEFEMWLTGSASEATALMVSAHEELLDKRPVSKRVNSSRTDDDDPTLIGAIDPSQPDEIQSDLISFMITNEQKENLRALGYDNDTIKEMSPADAHRSLGLVAKKGSRA